MLAALTVGESRIRGLLQGDDVEATKRAVAALGAHVQTLADGTVIVQGRGLSGLSEPASVLDLGNSGTAARLFCGLLAAQPFQSFMTGDASLVTRPMMRVIPAQ